MLAFVKPLAGIDRHLFGFTMAAKRADQVRFGYHSGHCGFTLVVDG